jgi:hypothetical protein
MQTNQKPNAPAWLTELQQKSWEPEVLLSGIVLYGMFQVPSILDGFVYYFNVNFTISTGDIDSFVRIMKVAVYWLTGGLIAHLISRGIWVGMVGLSFVFPAGINQENLKHADKYRTFLGSIPSTEEIILRLESFSSSLFSISFMLFMMMIGAYFFLFVTIIAPIVTLAYVSGNIFDGDIASRILAVYVISILIVGFIGFIDFVTLGYFKRFRWLSKVYWPIYRFVGALTLARFYRPIYYILVSNIRRWKIAVFVLGFVIISFWSVSGDATYPGERMSAISLWSDQQETGSFTGYYDDQMEDIKSVVASIQTDIIRGNTIRLFIVLRANREDSIKSYCNLDSLLKVDGLSSSLAKLKCISSFYTVAIDDSVVMDLPYKFHYKSKTKQRGILTYVDVSTLKSGLHHLTLSMPADMYKRPEVAKIPFYREESNVPYYVPILPDKDEDPTESYLKLKPILPK